jgi:hypothetical protein
MGAGSIIRDAINRGGAAAVDRRLYGPNGRCIRHRFFRNMLPLAAFAKLIDAMIPIM